MNKLLAILVLLSVSSTTFAATCKNFTMSIGTIGGYEISFSNICNSDYASTMSMAVSVDGKRVEVDSGTLSSEEVDVRQAISLRLTEGLSGSDARAILNVIGPALQSGDAAQAKISLIDLVLSDQTK